MPDHAESQSAQPLSPGGGEVLRSPTGELMHEPSVEGVTLGIGSRSRLVEEGHGPPPLRRPRGLLPVPAEVEAEVERQQARHAMTPEFSRTLRDRLTLEHYFADTEVAFRRTPHGIEVVAAGLDEIAEFRRTTPPEQRQGVVYGVG